jgi:hypothetical protein
MDPFTIGMVAVGVGSMLGGLFGSSSTAKKQAAEQKAIAADQMKIEAQKRQAMELDARRRELETFRNVQRTRSIALTNAVNQGAGAGSGLQGGLAQASQAGREDLTGIGQNLLIGRQISDLNNDISGHKMTLADLGADQSFYSGLSSFGSSMLGAVGPVGKLTSGWGNTANG